MRVHLLHLLSRGDSSKAKILKTQRSNLLSIPRSLYSSPLLFLSSPSFSLSPGIWIHECQVAAGQAATGRSSKMEVREYPILLHI